MRIAIVGAGVIGSGWAAHLLGQGHDVVATDPDPGAVSTVSATVEVARTAVEQLGGSLDGWRERFSFVDSVQAAVEGADWVQENGPEHPAAKALLLRQLDEHTPSEVVIASSSSGSLPSVLAAACPLHPERVVVGHPFNPTYVIPLVEVVAAPDTPASTVERAMAFYESVGKRPVHVRTEVPGYLANRLQAALWREAYSLVERGVATVADIDAVVSHGLGLRWSLLGPLVNQHLSGGEGGLAHVLRHLGPPTQRWMDDLGAPRLTDDLAALLVRGVDDELANVDQVAMAAERDRLLVSLLTLKAGAHDLP